jgi:hypothetical protein
MAGELCNSDTPKAISTPRKNAKNTPRVSRSKRAWQSGRGDAAVVVKASCENKSPAGIAFRDSEAPYAESRNEDSEGNGCKTENGREDPVLWIGEPLAADDGVKCQTRRKQGDDKPSKQAICFARENIDLPHVVAQRHNDENGSDDLKEKEKLSNHA